MNHYHAVLTVIRFIAVAIVLFYLYVMASILFSWGFDSAQHDGEMQGLVRNAQNQAVISSIKTLVAGVVLYFCAPLLSRIITIDSGRR